MASALPFFSLILFLFICQFTCITHGEDDEKYIVIPASSWKPGDVCSGPKAIAGTNHTFLVITHRHGPCSSFTNKKKPTWKEILLRDQVRVDYLQNRVSKGNSELQIQNSEISIPTNIGSAIGTNEYIITIGFGTPEVTQTVDIDTGSDLCWIQCNPCPPCYSQNDPLFDPSQSSSYNPISCNSDDCSQLPSIGCSNSQCGYKQVYGDGSYITGVYSYETLTLTPSDVINNFLFGCGHDDEGLFQGTDGLVGLGRGDLSLVSQTSQIYSGTFSYCLPASPTSTGFLQLGAPADTSSLLSTPMLTNAGNPSFYFVGLVAISVGGQQLSIPSTVFSSGGTILDSGTIITRLTPTAYAALRSAFRSYMSMYPSAPAIGILDTCYDFSGYENISIPTVALQFSGDATINLDGSGILTDSGCLAFAANKNAGALNIIGNVQQRTFEVVYNLGSESIGFRRNAC
ncbi:aspartyl protease family protein At5g10770-like [Ananas comosus]|uniref:Aspartyl protease family protein At5g10770-like n=1 Tax=Ananas comosus TaxID=4615 RepID=A0A6P5FAW0_ANACO|nr:aspartyl protease family protein At5g10770-like [Ananas comosus]